MDQRFKVDSAAGGLSIGIVWASDPSNTKMYRHKTIPLEGLMNLLHPLLELDLIDIHSLQVGADSSALDPGHSIHVYTTGRLSCQLLKKLLMLLGSLI